MNFLEFLQPMPVVGILRDIPQGAEEACVKAAAQCGLKAIEVTMNTAAATEIIAKLKSYARPLDIKVGAGTVRHGSDVEKAIAAGAEFLVTPNTRHEVIRLSSTAGIPIIPGDYIKALRGPFRDIPLMACGGVNAENAASYLKAGANLLSFGASIFNVEQMKSGDWETIEAKLQKLLDAVKAAMI